jgi:hypothetical protein
MNIETILRLLKNAGFRVLGTDGVNINLEDPTCILRSFETFLEYAWIAIAFIAGLLLFGWAISYIRGGYKTDSFFLNLRNLTLIFGILAAVKPVVNFVWGADVFARGCKTIHVPIAEVQRILAARNYTLSKNDVSLYEGFDIYDSGAIADLADDGAVPYEIAPLVGAGDAAPIPVSVSSTGGAGTYDGSIWGGQCTPSRASNNFANQTFVTGQYATSDPAFNKAMNTIFRAEGGYVNDPFDSGGETKYGVSKNNNPDIDVKNITRADAEQIAHDRYYRKYGIDRLPDGIRGDVFQVGWACGPRVAIRQLQELLGVSKTGTVDDATLRAAQSGPGDLRDKYLAVHRNYLIGITERKPSQKKFLRGWMNRVELIRDNGCTS